MIRFALVRNTLELLWSFLHLETLQMLDLLNQVTYAFSMAERMLPFRNLLKPATMFHWDGSLNQLFEESKTVIVSEISDGVKIFDKTKPTCLATNWSRHGIGFWLFQKHCSCPSIGLFCCRQGWKITLVGSRFTHPAESRYVPIEGEALAVADALDKARHFVLVIILWLQLTTNLY